MKRIVVHSSILFVVAALVLWSPPPALAVDCGGAVPCSCGDTVIADRTLDCGIDPITEPPACTGDGLLVNPSVILNLGGCTIRGGGSGTGVQLGDGATVTGGKIVGFGTGVFAAANAKVRVVRISQTSVAGIDSGPGSNKIVIEQNVLQHNEGIGISAEGDELVVRLNRIEGDDDTTGCGLIADGEKNLVERNIVLRAGECGIKISGLVGTVQRNQARYTQAGPGFIFSDAHNQQVSLNTSLKSDDDDPNAYAAHGFHVLATSTNNTFRRNVSSYNEGWGILDDSRDTGTSGTANTYIQNNCTGNALGNSSPTGLCQ